MWELFNRNHNKNDLIWARNLWIKKMKNLKKKKKEKRKRSDSILERVEEKILKRIKNDKRREKIFKL